MKRGRLTTFNLYNSPLFQPQHVWTIQSCHRRLIRSQGMWIWTCSLFPEGGSVCGLSYRLHIWLVCATLKALAVLSWVDTLKCVWCWQNGRNGLVMWETSLQYMSLPFTRQLLLILEIALIVTSGCVPPKVECVSTFHRWVVYRFVFYCNAWLSLNEA